MADTKDGPHSPLFTPLALDGNVAFADLPGIGISEGMAGALAAAPRGDCVGWGIPFMVGDAAALVDEPVAMELPPMMARWLVFMHTADLQPLPVDQFTSPFRGEGALAEHAADYVIRYADGTEARAAIRRRHQIGAFRKRWGENCFQSVPHSKARPLRASHEQLNPNWGQTQARVIEPGGTRQWLNWLWAWQNPHPEKVIMGLRFEPAAGVVIVSAVSAGNTTSNPLRWQTRQKALFTLPEGEPFRPDLDDLGLLAQIQLDLGQIISATPRPVYPNEGWDATFNNQNPLVSDGEVLVEYTAHPEAHFHLGNGRTIPTSQVATTQSQKTIQPIPPAKQRVTLRVVAQKSGQPTPVKLHIHGEQGEYLPPIDRHRIPNPAWFEDYSVDFVHTAGEAPHYATYIAGETAVNLPLGNVYIELSKGFEIRPLRTMVTVTPDTDEITIELKKTLAWREKGWVTADTHVHFLSPTTALLEGSAEGVNVINLLASQWGELMSNVGDFDGRTTWGAPESAQGVQETGGDGEYLVRVGTENRQHVLGHISLLGYSGAIIAPLTTGGPNESALGDPIETLLTEWARQCKKQGGLVVLPHFPDPRAEHAATIVGGDADAIEMTSWGNLYGGIDPYSLSDWYRYLNCGYLVPVVGGTDKMSAKTAVGAVRTYARLQDNRPFTYQSWMDAVQRGETFVTYGPLLEFTVDGNPMGSRLQMAADGGTVDVMWQVASVLTPMTRVELVVNGEIRESVAVAPDQAAGQWSVKIEKSCWLALLVRGHHPGQPEIIAAHSSPVMIMVAGSQLLAAADAVTILDQIEGSMAYLDTIGTRADDGAYKRMRLTLTAVHRTLHNRMHRLGYYHEHNPVMDHGEDQ